QPRAAGVPGARAGPVPGGGGAVRPGAQPGGGPAVGGGGRLTAGPRAGGRRPAQRGPTAGGSPQPNGRSRRASAAPTAAARHKFTGSPWRKKPSRSGGLLSNYRAATGGQ